MNRDINRIGKYKIIEVLGKGGFGTVYLVQDGEKFFALKKLDESGKQEYIKKFFQEFKRIVKFSKEYKLDYLVKIVDTLEEENAFVMEYIEDDSMDYFCRCRKNEFLTKIVQAIHQLHSADIVHRDLKPQHIRVKKSNPIFIDFGLSSWWDSKSGIVPIGMTKVYSPPEVVVEHYLNKCKDLNAAYKAREELNNLKNNNFSDPYKNAKKLQDVFGLGITIGELLTGRIPFRVDSCDYFQYLDTGKSIAYSAWISSIPGKFQHFVELATTFSPQNRLQLSALLPILEIEPLTELIGINGRNGIESSENDTRPAPHENSASFIIHTESNKGILGENLPPSIQIVYNLSIGKFSIVIDLNGEDFNIKLGRAKEKVHIAFTDDNWMSNIHGHLVKNGNKVFYVEGNEGEYPSKRTLLDNEVTVDKVELAPGSFLLLGSTKLIIKK